MPGLLTPNNTGVPVAGTSGLKVTITMPGQGRALPFVSGFNLFYS